MNFRKNILEKVIKYKAVFLALFLISSAVLASKRFGGDMVTQKPNTPFNEEKEKTRLTVRKICQSFIGNNHKFINHNGRRYRNDCSGMVKAVFDTIDIDVFQRASTARRGANGVEIIYHSFKEKFWTNHKKKMPRPGDLILFKNTYDKNKNGKWDDNFTHVSVVTGVEKNGTIAFIHHVRNGIQRYRMNLDKKKIHKENGVKFNDYLRRRPKQDKQSEKYLSSNMFYGFLEVLEK
ncbi:MAG: CHAP domain-containing protein [Spirochaetia bacterium]|nr:CHAP domain-containing protein [Spirochaetia bacterium]